MDARDRIVVVGSAERTVAPDAALVTVRVLEVDDDKRAAGLTEQLLAEAVGVAQRKAARLAAAADGSLGSVVGIEELREGGIAEAAAGGRSIDLRPASISVAAGVRVAFALAGPEGRSG